MCSLTSYLCYLSLIVVGEPFLNFQWDALLCETLLLSLPFLPLTKFHKIGDQLPISNLARFLIIVLLAKLMLESGIVKFTSLVLITTIPGATFPPWNIIIGLNPYPMVSVDGYSPTIVD